MAKEEIKVKVNGRTVKYVGHPEEKTADFMEIVVKMKVKEEDVVKTFRDNFPPGSTDKEYSDATILKMFHMSAAAIQKRRSQRAAAASGGSSGSYADPNSPASPSSGAAHSPAKGNSALDNSNSNNNNDSSNNASGTVTRQKSEALESLNAISTDEKAEIDEFIKRVLHSDVDRLADTMIGYDPAAEAEAEAMAASARSPGSPNTSRHPGSLPSAAAAAAASPRPAAPEPTLPPAITSPLRPGMVELECQLGRDKKADGLHTRLRLPPHNNYDDFQRAVERSVGEGMRTYFLDSDDDEIEIDDDDVFQNFMSIIKFRPLTVICIPEKEAAPAANASDKDTVRIAQPKELVGHRHVVFDCCAMRGRDRLLSCSKDGTLKVWDTAANSVIRTIENTHKESIFTCAASPTDANLIATGSADTTVKLWNLGSSSSSGAPTKVCTLSGHAGKVHYVQFSPKGDFLVSAGSDRCLMLWSTTYHIWKSSNLRMIESGITGSVFTCCLSNTDNGKYVVAGGMQGSLPVIATGTGKVVLTIKGHNKPVWGVRYSNDDKHIVSAGLDTEVRLWDSQTGRLVHVMKGHTGPVHSVCFTADDRYVISCGNDQTVRVWERMTGKPAACVLAHRRTISRVCVMDGKSFATASLDHQLKVFTYEEIQKA